MFPPEVRRYGGMTAEFKATSQHIPVELLKKISFRLEGHWAPDSKEENEKIFVAEKATEILPENRKRGLQVPDAELQQFRKDDGKPYC